MRNGQRGLKQRESRMNLCICDDEKLVADALQRIVKEEFKKMNMSVKIDKLYSGRELLNKIRCYDAVFLI